MTTVANILHAAADKYLWSGEPKGGRPGRYAFEWPGKTAKMATSCHAICQALREALGIEAASGHYPLWRPDVALASRTLAFITDLGCDTTAWDAFGPDFKDLTIEERQGIRYAWLKFAAHVAEEQGL